MIGKGTWKLIGIVGAVVALRLAWDNRRPILRQFQSWQECYDVLVQSRRGTAAIVPKWLLPHPSCDGAQAGQGLPVGQIAEYRFPSDDTGASLHVRDFGDYYHVHLDTTHPDYGLVRHFVIDGVAVAPAYHLGIKP